ncbi:MAG: DegV family protein [Anaerolineae bacterium]|nr:DegV family protein [Anaerolineae bacterium]MDW8101966.1 DegV family protein [Anaerolineae bacterium]
MVKIVTDSGAVFEDEAEVKKLGITVVPLRIELKDKIYREGVDIDSEGLAREIARTRSIPTSLPPTRDHMEKVYQKIIKEEGDEIVGIYTSSYINPVASVAREASIPFLGRARITIIDSEVSSYALGLMVREAAKAAQKGRSMDAIVRLVRGMIPYMYIASFSQDLKFLRHKKIISPSQAILGTMMGIKVFLIVEDGKFVPLEKVQTEEEMAEKLVEFTAEFVNIKRLAMLKNDLNEVVNAFLEKFSSLSFKVKPTILPLNPSMICYLGPKAISLIIQEGGS